MTELPREIRSVVESELENVPAIRLRAASERLSSRYRDAHGSSGTRIGHEDDALIYAAVRMPATFAAAKAAALAVAESCPDWEPRSILDIGAGTGASSLAALECWSEIERACLVEPDARMRVRGQRLLAASRHEALRRARWMHGGIDTLPTASSYDLVICGYVLNELREPGRSAFVRELWRRADGVLILIEPGTPRAFRAILDAREQLLSSGGHIAAPCPHCGPCPMADDDWCHFAARIGRSRLHRIAKTGALSFEDEKYSFVAASRFGVIPAQSRIVRKPRTNRGHIILTLCHDGEITERTYSRRKDGQRFRDARNARWGDAWALADVPDQPGADGGGRTPDATIADSSRGC